LVLAGNTVMTCRSRKLLGRKGGARHVIQESRFGIDPKPPPLEQLIVTCGRKRFVQHGVPDVRSPHKLESAAAIGRLYPCAVMKWNSGDFDRFQASNRQTLDYTMASELFPVSCSSDRNRCRQSLIWLIMSAPLSSRYVTTCKSVARSQRNRNRRNHQEHIELTLRWEASLTET